MASAGSRTFIKKGARERTTPVRVARASLEAQALRLRRDGHTLDEVAEMLGGDMTESKVSTLIQSALSRAAQRPAEHIRDQLHDDLDRLMNRAIRIARSDRADRVSAINAAVNVANRIAALKGLDAPKALDIKDERQLPPDAAARKEFLARLAAEASSEES